MALGGIAENMLFLEKGMSVGVGDCTVAECARHMNRQTDRAIVAVGGIAGKTRPLGREHAFR